MQFLCNRIGMKEVADPDYFWVRSCPMLVDGNEVISALGPSGSRRYNINSVVFGLNFPILKLRPKNTFMGKKNGK